MSGPPDGKYVECLKYHFGAIMYTCDVAGEFNIADCAGYCKLLSFSYPLVQFSEGPFWSFRVLQTLIPVSHQWVLHMTWICARKALTVLMTTKISVGRPPDFVQSSGNIVWIGRPWSYRYWSASARSEQEVPTCQIRLYWTRFLRPPKINVRVLRVLLHPKSKEIG